MKYEKIVNQNFSRKTKLLIRKNVNQKIYNPDFSVNKDLTRDNKAKGEEKMKKWNHATYQYHTKMAKPQFIKLEIASD